MSRAWLDMAADDPLLERGKQNARAYGLTKDDLVAAMRRDGRCEQEIEAAVKVWEPHFAAAAGERSDGE